MEDTTTEQVGAWKGLWLCGKPMILMYFYSPVYLSDREALIGFCCPASTKNLPVSMLEWSKVAVFCFCGDLGEYRQLCYQSDSWGNLAAPVPLQLILDVVSEEEYMDQHRSVCVCMWGGGPGSFWHYYTALNSMERAFRLDLLSTSHLPLLYCSPCHFKTLSPLYCNNHLREDASAQRTNHCFPACPTLACDACWLHLSHSACVPSAASR